MKFQRVVAFAFLICLTITQSFATQFGEKILLSGQDSLSTWMVEFPDHPLIPIHKSLEIAIGLMNGSDDDSLIILSDSKDPLGEHHIRTIHLHKGVEVVGSQIVFHYKNNKLISFNGHFYKPQKQSVVRLEKEVALKNALEYCGAKNLYAWQVAGMDSLLRIWTNGERQSFYPTGKLVYVAPGFNFSNQQPVLSWVFEIYQFEPLANNCIYVDASNGEIIAMENRLPESNSTALAKTRYSGQQDIVTDSLGVNSFRLRESGRGGGIETYNLQNLTNYSKAIDFTDADNFWDNANPEQDEVATDAHWGAEWTYDYYYYKFNRNSYDDKGTPVKSYIHYSKKYNNAFWNGYVMTYGDGDSSTFFPLTCIDVCGHEITHAVTSSTAALIYQNESGALNESFSDMFGNAIEYFAKPGSASWTIGEDITPSGTGLRQMQNPNAKGNPDTYKGKYWKTGTGDNGGVHTNSGVQNYWFYLISEGGTGTNDNSDFFVVDSIGIQKAEAIAYRNLTVYLTPSSDYADARYFSIRSAEDLFGRCSKEVIAVTNAWYAVGVGPEYDSAIVTAGFFNDSFLCHPDQIVAFTNRSSNALWYEWDFGDGDTSQSQNPEHRFSGYGSFDIRLIAHGCFKQSVDTLLITKGVKIDSTQDVCHSVWMPKGSWDTVRICTGFIYDDGGEDLYQTFIRDTLTIVSGKCDSMVLTFSVFDFENKFDSLYLYDGPDCNSKLIGGFTGNQLAGGKKIVGYTGSITLRQFADQLVTGAGFKAELEVFRDQLQLMVPEDTLMCFGQSAVLTVHASGGDPEDYRFYWEGMLRDSSIFYTAAKDSVLHVLLEDYCMKELIRDSFQILVRDPLIIEPIRDTVICYLQTVSFTAILSGGDSLKRGAIWMPFNLRSDSLSFSGVKSTDIMVIASDGCSATNDTTSFHVKILPPLELTTTGDTTVCFHSSSTLKAHASGGSHPYSFEWNGVLSSDSSITPVFDSDSTFQVVLTDGCSGVGDTSLFIVRVLDPLVVTARPDTIVCYKSKLQLDAIASGGDSGAYKFKWTPDVGNSSTPQISAVANQYYSVEVSDGCSGINAVDSVLVQTFSALQISISGHDTACHGEQLYFQSYAAGGMSSGYKYQWSQGLGNNSSANLNADRDTTIYLILTDGCSGENDTAAFRLYVRPPLQLAITNDKTICAGDTLHLNAAGSGGKPAQYYYFWDNGGSPTPSIVISPKFSTTYKLTLSDNCSSFVEDSVVVTVNPTPKLNFSWSPNPQCSKQPIQFNNHTPDAENYQNHWWFGDGTGSQEFEPVHSYAEEGIYRVSLVVINQFGCKDSSEGTDVVEIIPNPVAAFIHDPTVATVDNRKFSFTNKSEFSTSYEWSFGDGNTDTAQSPEYVYADTGHYEVRLIAMNDMGCRDEIREVLRVKDVYLSFIPNAFTPTKDGINESFHPYIKGLLKYKMEIYTRWGELIFRTEDADEGWDGKNQDGNVMPSGVYLFVINGLSVDGEHIRESGMVRLLR
ncbi:MAG: PKD domain-containing protein [Bacteroidetes bacterium]|nr:PKD domain-containing protein [Bacteroidota bacterium]